MEVNELIKYISDMSIIDKLKLGISVFSSSYINTSYNKKEMVEKMDSKLKEIDKSYIMSFSGIYDHTVVMFVMSKVMEFTKEEQNRIAMYLVNSI